MKTFWFIIYIISLVMITCLLPYAIFFYETDPENHMIKRLLTALLYTVIALILVCILLFVSWAFLKYVQIPVEEISVTNNAFVDSSDSSNITSFSTAVNPD